MHPSGSPIERVGSDDRGIQAARAEEIHQRGIDVGEGTGSGSSRAAAANGKRTGRSRLSRRQSVVVSRLKIGNHQVATNRVGIDGPVQVAPAVEVVGQTESEAVAKIALDGEVGLLRVGVHEILSLRIAEGLEAERQECATGSDNSG